MIIDTETRALMFEASAKLSKQPRVAAMYNETAAVLRAQAAAYNDLFAAAELAVQEGDLTALRAHVRLIVNARNKARPEASGAA